MLLSDLCWFALQHRGQEAAGMVTFREPDVFTCHKDLGLVVDVFSKGAVADLSGKYALGHVRYSQKAPTPAKMLGHKAGHLWVASNGDVVNYTSQRISWNKTTSPSSRQTTESSLQNQSFSTVSARVGLSRGILSS